MFGRYLFLASGLLGIALLASGSWLGWIFLLATALIILWLTNVIQRFWLELVGFSLLLAGTVLMRGDTWSWGLAALLAGLVVCWGRTWWPVFKDWVRDCKKDMDAIFHWHP